MKTKFEKIKMIEKYLFGIIVYGIYSIMLDNQSTHFERRDL